MAADLRRRAAWTFRLIKRFSVCLSVSCSQSKDSHTRAGPQERCLTPCPHCAGDEAGSGGDQPAAKPQVAVKPTVQGSKKGEDRVYWNIPQSKSGAAGATSLSRNPLAKEVIQI